MVTHKWPPHALPLWLALSDMEIYVESAKTETVINWLAKEYDVSGSIDQAGAADVFSILTEGYKVRVIVTTCIESSVFTSIWFNSEILPWENLEELVLAAEKNFSSRIRYEKPGLAPVIYERFNGKISEVSL